MLPLPQRFEIDVEDGPGSSWLDLADINQVGGREGGLGCSLNCSGLAFWKPRSSSSQL